MIAGSIAFAPPGVVPAAFLVLQHAKLHVPVREAEHQPRDIRIAGENLGFDCGNLALTSFYSRIPCQALSCDLVEGSAVTIKHSFFASELLIAPHDAVSILGIDFH